MVTGLHLAFKDFLPDGSAAKSHSQASDTAGSLSFGGILRAKEEQLQDAQTVSASSIVAAVQNAYQGTFVSELIARQVPAETKTVETETNSLPQAVTREAPQKQPQQVLAAVTVAEDTLKTNIETVTVEPTTGAITEMGSREIKTSQEATFTFIAPQNGQFAVDSDRAQLQDEVSPSKNERSIFPAQNQGTGNVKPDTHPHSESEKATLTTATKTGTHSGKATRSTTEAMPSSSKKGPRADKRSVGKGCFFDRIRTDGNQCRGGWERSTDSTSGIYG